MFCVIVPIGVSKSLSNEAVNHIFHVIIGVDVQGVVARKQHEKGKRGKNVDNGTKIPTYGLSSFFYGQKTKIVHHERCEERI